MYYYHLSYDNGKMDAADIARVLRDELNVSQIGRPVESTMVFLMDGGANDVDRISNALKQKFASDDACFVVSRVSRVKCGENDIRNHVRVKAGKTHVDGFDAVIANINNDGTCKICVRNLRI